MTLSFLFVRPNSPTHPRPNSLSTWWNGGGVLYFTGIVVLYALEILLLLGGIGATFAIGMFLASQWYVSLALFLPTPATCLSVLVHGACLPFYSSSFLLLPVFLLLSLFFSRFFSPSLVDNPRFSLASDAPIQLSVLRGSGGPASWENDVEITDAAENAKFKNFKIPFETFYELYINGKANFKGDVYVLPSELKEKELRIFLKKYPTYLQLASRCSTRSATRSSSSASPSTTAPLSSSASSPLSSTTPRYKIIKKNSLRR